MKPTYKRLTGLRKLAMVAAVGTMFQFGGCNLSEFTTSASLTLTARDLVNLLLIMVSMAIAIGATLLGTEVQSYWAIGVAVIIGAVIGIVVALRIQMTAMPQLVAALHSFVGMAAVLVAIGTYINHAAEGSLNPVMMGELSAGIIIGAITFSGSVVAFAKLQGLVSGAPVIFTGQHALNALMALAAIGFGIHFGMTESVWSLAMMTLLASTR